MNYIDKKLEEFDEKFVPFEGEMDYYDQEAQYKIIKSFLKQALEEQREEAQEEYKQFVLNILDGVDIADGFCNTKAIRFAIESRIITNH